ncbi:GntR family transcriptional regulator [Ornithinimicrobium cryptoxanthini]|uniref:GntR family transcriptional regulator n=1 Tax=Ornithinimicrobium cryptoxanthini TaxID=2934161 RepID=UPI002118932A|nr:GntR family transcriptional regulator [Ornithinimicrobium cryptoxanthini]
MGELPHAPDAAAGTRRIDRSLPVPYYHQIKEILREQVNSGVLRPGDKLDGEHELARRYGVSRPVVRQALAGLHRENVLDRIRGQGTFVAEPRTTQSLVRSVHGLYDDVHSMGRTLRSQVSRMVVEPADADIGHRLRVERQAPVVRLERLRFVDDEPWVYTISHVPFTLAPDMAQEDFREQSLYHFLRDRHGLEVHRSDRIVEAQRSDADLAKDLQIAAGDPVLKLTSVSFGPDETPIETFVAFHRADRSRFEVSLTRSDAGAPPTPVVRII